MRRTKFKDVAARLAWARAASGLSSYALSLRAGLKKGHARQIENRERVNIQLETAEKLAAALGIDWAWLLTGKGEPPTVAQIKRAVAGAA